MYKIWEIALHTLRRILSIALSLEEAKKLDITSEVTAYPPYMKGSKGIEIAEWAESLPEYQALFGNDGIKKIEIETSYLSKDEFTKIMGREPTDDDKILSSYSNPPYMRSEYSSAADDGPVYPL